MDELVDAAELQTAFENYELSSSDINGLFTNVTVLSMLMLSLTRDRPYPKTSPSFRGEYDYIIAGGGSAGSVMANRLSQKPCVRVLLLEAGGNAPLLTEVPALARFFFGSEIDWLYKTVPQRYGAFGQNENRVVWNSGKALGGGSVLNAMLYVRGNMKNYDNWEKEGATGWGYKGVLPYFKKLEENRNIKELDHGYHSIKGPLTAEKPNYTPEIKNPILDAAQSMGFELTDPNGRRQMGLYDIQGTLRNGQRCSTAKAYLVPAEDRPNLTILKRAFVRKILIRNRRAYGVEFDYLGRTRTVFARKSVVVSAGSVRTTQLLMLSGIGPREHLEKFKIPVIADLPVGKNLQDHYATNLNYLVNSTIANVLKKLVDPINILNYIVNRSGAHSSPTLVTYLAFLDGFRPTKRSKDFCRQELYFAEFNPIDAKLHYNMRPEVYEQVYGPYERQPMYTCIVSLMQPYSRGEILLNSTDPYDYPLINPNYYQDERDVRDMVEGMKVCQAIGTSREMQQVQSRPFDTLYPGCERFAGNDDQYFACEARTLITSFWHPVGVARMGQPDDPRSVVDPELRVIGIEGLRVVNAAVMPIIPSANTNVPTIMIAEKAYDMMKDEMSCSDNRWQQKEKDPPYPNIPQFPEEDWEDESSVS